MRSCTPAGSATSTGWVGSALGCRSPRPAFGVGALGAAALPLSAGFVAEWVLLQALIHGEAGSDRVLAVLLPAAMGVVALTAGLALLTFVKAFGIGFLARPRSEGAAAAHEVSLSMRAALVGVAPRPCWPSAWCRARWPRSSRPALAGAGARSPRRCRAWRCPASTRRWTRPRCGLIALACAVPVLVVARLLSRRAPRRAVDLGWGCGGARVSPRMQYTATSYAEPLVRVFGHALEPERDLEVQHYEESQHLIHGIAYTHEVSDIVEDRLYARVVRAARPGSASGPEGCRTAASTATSATRSPPWWSSCWRRRGEPGRPGVGGAGHGAGRGRRRASPRCWSG